MQRLFGYIAICLFFSCSQGKSPQAVDSSNTEVPISNALDSVTSNSYVAKPGTCVFALVSDLKLGKNGTYSCAFRKTSYRFYLQNPPIPNGMLLVLLPGWNYPVLDWKHKTVVVDSALVWGFQVLLCDMGKSVYMDSVYPEAREDYKEFATRTWLWDSIIGPCYRVIGERNLVLLGLSTGARGAVFMGMEHQNEVDGVIALSGDYFPVLDTADGLMRNSMGAYWRFPRRWNLGKNQASNLDGFPKFVFLAHGTNDKIVPMMHTQKLKEHFVAIRTTETLQVHLVSGAHDYKFWNQWALEGLKTYLTANH